MKILFAYVGFLVSFLAIDSVWISLVVIPLYTQEVGHLMASESNAIAAVLFYLIYAAGALFICREAMQENSMSGTFLNGAVAGGLAYGTYAFTNFAVLDGWSWILVVSDVAWGLVITGTACCVGLLASRMVAK
ncbi:DUF2177 family protein [Arenicella xantha]|uniref:Putative membrane protein n=1 Tax=Arenicella xantha TaxID=644221 RepID=A0A395JLM4_9GAMM|nr:DUF2177 family protein [Arenicella xantha]RBP51662.1 putative membrane protein [Arenicella xantha]